MISPIRTTALRTEDLDVDTRAGIVNLCVEAHDETSFLNLFVYIPSGGLHVLAYVGNELAGHAVATERWMQPEGLPRLRTAYIDAVSTRPAHQGRGVGSAVMRRLAAEVGDFDIACLETDITGFYTRLGWEEWRGPLAGRRQDKVIPTPNQTGIMVLRLPRTPPLDPNQGLVIECTGTRIW